MKRKHLSVATLVALFLITMMCSFIYANDIKKDEFKEEIKISKLDMLIYTLLSQKLEENIITKEYKKVDGHSLKLDIYPPLKEQDKHPVLLYIHYGYWKGEGRKGVLKDFKPFIYVMNRMGCYVISIDVRKPPAHRFPANVIDSKDAIRWIYKNAEKHRFDTKRIGVMGGSSGGHLALMTALTDNHTYIGSKDLMDYPSTLNCALTFGAPTYFNEESSKEDFVKEYLGDYASNKLSYIKASPIFYVDEESIPILLVHGTGDEYVPFEHAEKIMSLGIEKGLDFRILKLENGKHTAEEILSQSSETDIVEIINSANRFLMEQFYQ